MESGRSTAAHGEIWPYQRLIYEPESLRERIAPFAYNYVVRRKLANSSEVRVYQGATLKLEDLKDTRAARPSYSHRHVLYTSLYVPPDWRARNFGLQDILEFRIRPPSRVAFQARAAKLWPVITTPTKHQNCRRSVAVSSALLVRAGCPAVAAAHHNPAGRQKRDTFCRTDKKPRSNQL